MLQVNIAGTVSHNIQKPHHAVKKQSHRQLVVAFNNILTAMHHEQRQKVEAEIETLWVLINTSF